MAKQDFVPRTDGAFLTWHDNFKTQLAAIAGTVGMGGGEIGRVTNDNTALQTAMDNAVAKKAAAQSTVAAKNDVAAETECARKRNKDLWKNPAFAPQR